MSAVYDRVQFKSRIVGMLSAFGILMGLRFSRACGFRLTIVVVVP